MKFRRNTAAGAAANNAILAAGEPGYETDSKTFKIGDGVTAWNALPLAMSGTYAGKAASAAGPLIQKLRLGVDDANLTIIGDSTGSNTQSQSWGPRFVAWLGAQFPAYTVIRYEWTVGTGYDAGTTVQTGTGSVTLRVYNGSAPGQPTQYSVTNLATLCPATPDCVIINHGHNNGEAITPNPPSQPGYRAILLSLIQPIRRAYPRAGIFLTAQNLESSPVAGATISLHQRYAEIVAAMAGSEGCGLIDVMSAYAGAIAAGTALSALTGTGDGIHPTPVGYNLWLATAQTEFPTAVRTMPTLPRRSTEQLIVPAGAFGVVQGSPTVSFAAQDAFSNQLGSIFTFGDAAVASIGTWVTIPSHWETWDASILWSAAATSGVCFWNLLGYGLTIGLGSGVAGVKPLNGLTTNAFPGGNFAITAPGSASTLTKTPIWTGYTIDSEQRHLTVTVRRIGDNAGDTMVGNADFHGLILERVS